MTVQGLGLGGFFLFLHLLFFSVVPIKIPIIPKIQYLLFSMILNEEHSWATWPFWHPPESQSPGYRCQLLIDLPQWQCRHHISTSTSHHSQLLQLLDYLCTCTMRLTTRIELVHWKTRLLFRNYSRFSPFPIILKIVPEHFAQVYLPTSSLPVVYCWPLFLHPSWLAHVGHFPSPHRYHSASSMVQPVGIKRAGVTGHHTGNRWIIYWLSKPVLKMQSCKPSTDLHAISVQFQHWGFVCILAVVPQLVVSYTYYLLTPTWNPLNYRNCSE